MTRFFVQVKWELWNFFTKDYFDGVKNQIETLFMHIFSAVDLTMAKNRTIMLVQSCTKTGSKMRVSAE